MRIRFVLLTVFLPLALTACETDYRKSPVATPQPMNCTGNLPATVILYSPSDARLTFEDKAYDLKRVDSTTGIKYASDSISFWNKGIDALITRKDGSMVTCAYIPRAGL